MRTPRALAALTAAALSLTVAGCGGGGGTTGAAPTAKAADFPAGSVMRTLADRGSLKVGTKFDQPLFGLKGLSGKPEGFDVEVAKLIAAKLGIGADKIEWVETVSANREPFLQNKQVDMVVATYTITAKRDQVIDFAGPYFNAGQDILVKKGNPDKITGPDSLAGKKVCTVAGSTPASTMQTKYPQASLVLFDTYSKCRDALKSGTDGVVALTTDNVILSGYVAQAPNDFELVGKPFTEEPYGIGIPEGQEPFCDFINTTLKQAADDGSLQKAFDSTAGKVLKQKLTLPPPYGCTK